MAELQNTGARMYGEGNVPHGIISSLRDLEYRVALAQSEGVKELETTPELMSQLLKAEYKDGARSIVYKNVRLFEVGTRDKIVAKEEQTITQRLHGTGRLKF